MLVDSATLILYVPVVTAMALTPGSDTLFILSRSLANGAAAGFATGLGICTVPSRGNLLFQALVLITIANAIEIVVVAAIALSAGRLGRFLARHPFVARIQHRLVGCIFIGLAARLAFADRRP